MGAAGRDFHDFGQLFRDDSGVRVVAFTAAQIPHIEDRVYPAQLAGPLYPDGIPIRPESEMESLIKEHAIDEVIFAYSDVSHEMLMHLASRVLAAGAGFRLPGPTETMLRATRLVVAVGAVRTGCGKSQVARHLSAHFRGLGRRVAVIRHPMPYGDLVAQAVQRFAHRDDLSRARCSIEEREEYEPHLAEGAVVFAGVDYGAILRRAEAEADLILWDGGNNDFPFIKPDVMITLVDALRPDLLDTHHPGETTLRLADLVVIAKADAAPIEAVREMEARLADLLPGRPVLRGGSPVRLDNADQAAGKRVILVEDGPTLTHGGMPWGAAHHAAMGLSGVTIVDPRASATGEIAAMYRAYPHIGPVLPAMGYGEAQVAALRQTLSDAQADVIIAATPIDLAALMDPGKPILRARYNFADLESPGLAARVEKLLEDRAGREGRS